MVPAKHILECPFCYEIVEVEAPDEFHTSYSTAKPVAKSYHADVLVKKHECQNPKCRKPVTVYWYAPLDYFSRV